jgi:hypothetical protein
MVPEHGDILVSNPTATVEHVISIVPEPAEIVCPSHDVALARAREIAKDRQVDVWLTEDHTHFMKIASYRLADRPMAR